MEDQNVKYTFGKAERLCSHNAIEELFAHGKGFIKYPFRVVYMPMQLAEEVPMQVICSVSKRKFKRANKRNVIRRRMKEAFRFNKHLLYDTIKAQNIQLAVVIIYLPNELMDFTTISQGMVKALDKLKSLVVTLEA